MSITSAIHWKIISIMSSLARIWIETMTASLSGEAMCVWQTENGWRMFWVAENKRFILACSISGLYISKMECVNKWKTEIGGMTNMIAGKGT